MTVYLIRHAESVSNAGDRPASHGGAELSSEGRRQAEALTARIGFRPDLIVVSPFVRTRQTAEPLRQKYPDVPVEEWPVQEFSFLDADRCADTTQEERRPLAEAYFARNDPDYVDGKDAESFNQLLARVDDMLTRLRALPGENKTVVFTHGNFMRAERLRLGGGPFSMTEFLRQPAAENTEIVDITSYL